MQVETRKQQHFRLMKQRGSSINSNVDRLNSLNPLIYNEYIMNPEYSIEQTKRDVLSLLDDATYIYDLIKIGYSNELISIIKDLYKLMGGPEDLCRIAKSFGVDANNKKNANHAVFCKKDIGQLGKYVSSIKACNVVLGREPLSNNFDSKFCNLFFRIKSNLNPQEVVRFRNSIVQNLAGLDLWQFTGTNVSQMTKAQEYFKQNKIKAFLYDHEDHFHCIFDSKKLEKIRSWIKSNIEQEQDKKTKHWAIQPIALVHENDDERDPLNNHLNYAFTIQKKRGGFNSQTYYAIRERKNLRYNLIDEMYLTTFSTKNYNEYTGFEPLNQMIVQRSHDSSQFTKAQRNAAFVLFTKILGTSTKIPPKYMCYTLIKRATTSEVTSKDVASYTGKIRHVCKKLKPNQPLTALQIKESSRPLYKDMFWLREIETFLTNNPQMHEALLQITNNYDLFQNLYNYITQKYKLKTNNHVKAYFQIFDPTTNTTINDPYLIQYIQNMNRTIGLSQTP